MTATGRSNLRVLRASRALLAEESGHRHDRTELKMGRSITVSSRPCDDTPLDEDLATEESEDHPAGRMNYLPAAMIGMRVAALAGLAITVGAGVGAIWPGSSTCCLLPPA